MHKTTYPCVGLSRVQGNVHMNRREPQRRCCWRPIPLADEALCKQTADKPQPAYTKTIHRERTQNPPRCSHILTPMRRLPLGSPDAALYRTTVDKCRISPRAHAGYDRATLPTSTRRRVHEALKLNVPMRHFETKGYATRPASKPTRGQTTTPQHCVDKFSADILC